MSGPRYYDPKWVKAHRIQRHNQPATMPVGPVATHVRALMAAGAHSTWIADASGTTRYTITRLGRPDVTGTVRYPIGIRVLAVTYEAAYALAPPGARVSSVGTLRRLQALLWKGWRHSDFRPFGLTRTSQITADAPVTIATHLAVAAMFRELHTKDGPSNLTRRRAIRAGYQPPGAWDNMDDPNEVPDVGAASKGPVWVEDAEHMAEAGESAEGAAVRLGRSDGRSLGRALRHLGRQDLVDRFAANGSRVS